MRLLEKLCSSNSRSSAPKPAFAKVLTPNRIPEFCIPPRLPAPCALESPSRAAARPRRCAAEHEDGRPHGLGPALAGRVVAAALPPLLHRLRPRVLARESPHTRRKGVAPARGPSAPRPRHTPCGGCGAAPPGPVGPPSSQAATPAVPGRPLASGRSVPRPRLRSARPTGLLEPPAAGPGRVAPPCPRRSVSSGNEDEERRAGSQSPARAPSASPPSSRDPLPERLEAEGTLALGRAGDALRLAAEYCPGTGRLRLRLLRAEGLAGGAPGPRAVRCRLSLVLRPPDTARRQCSVVVGRSRKASFDQDFCFDGLSEDEVRRLAVRVKAWDEGRGRERGRLLGQGELSLGALLLL
uniref:C2 calcium dependent domain containing 4B n=1 Tax=Rhinopithecus bieti TaxID=61621 RepID=A0A2K6MU85_RHIBE